MIRLFISHRDEHKAMAKELASALEGYGVSCFVAHDSIQPMSVWQMEILKGLESMEVLLAFITDDFQESVWTNQEIGFSLAREIPIIPLKLQRQDPSGFISRQQALKCSYDDVANAVPNIYKILADKLGNRDRLQASLVRAFVSSPNFDETRARFDRMRDVVSTLSDDELNDIIVGFRENDQLHKAIYLTSRYERLAKFLSETSGRDFLIRGKVISHFVDDGEDDIPF